jgi:hypothetical protein
LKKLIDAKTSVPIIARTLGKSLEAVRVKIRRLGLVVVDREKKILCSTTTTAELVLRDELFSVEEVLKELHAAVMGLKLPGWIKLNGSCVVLEEVEQLKNECSAKSINITANNCGP